MIRAARRFEAPVPQRVTVSGWCVARQPGVPSSLRVLFKGEHVGWVEVLTGGWRYHTERRTRAGRYRPYVSTVVYESWVDAVEALAKTAFAKRIAGRDSYRAEHVPPGPWLPVPGLRGRPWTPKAAAS